MAMPTWACARAGASFMPSPAMATKEPSSCRLFTFSPLSCGRTSANTSSIPSFSATACAVLRLSPVIITMRIPCWCSCSTASGVVSLMGSATPKSPASSPPMATNMAVWPSFLTVSACSCSGCGSICKASSSQTLPRATWRPPIWPFTPFPVNDSKDSALTNSTSRCSAPATMAAARGCSLPRSRLAAA